MTNSQLLFKKVVGRLDMFDRNGEYNATVKMGMKFVKNGDDFDIYKYDRFDREQILTSNEIAMILKSNNILKAVNCIGQKTRHVNIELGIKKMAMVSHSQK